MRTVLTLIVLLYMAGSGLDASAQTAASAVSASVNRDPAGKVELIEGDVRVTDRLNKTRTVRVGDAIYEGDHVATGADGELHLAMEDAGFIAVRSNTKMGIVQYRARGDKQDKGVISLLKGSLRSISGWIGKHQPESYQIRTPTATIGIRGTDHEPNVIPEGSTEGEPGTYDKVNVGGTYIQTAEGRIDVPEKKAAFAPHTARPGASRPRLLDSVPRFYRPTRHEHVLEKKHEFIRQSVEKRREEKRQHIKERIRTRDKDKVMSRERRQNQAETRSVNREEKRQQRLERRQKNTEQKPGQEKPRREAKAKHEAKTGHEAKPNRERKKRRDNDG